MDKEAGRIIQVRCLCVGGRGQGTKGTLLFRRAGIKKEILERWRAVTELGRGQEVMELTDPYHIPAGLSFYQSL